MVGIHDVARAAGVSASTVSNVLNGHDNRMRAETKTRVLAAISELRYTPNVVARQLKSGQNRTIGLIVPSVANPFWGALAYRIEHAAKSFGYKVLMCNAERDPMVEARYAETLLGSGVRGVILSSSPSPWSTSAISWSAASSSPHSTGAAKARKASSPAASR